VKEPPRVFHFVRFLLGAFDLAVVQPCIVLFSWLIVVCGGSVTYVTTISILDYVTIYNLIPVVY
jgi:hypothetical protein